ncbi:putative signal transduction protein with CBS domains [Thioalkalivibrio sulfidiphilus HL-EbGr7]|uniref:Putative signal transduction protein with CBS domains n=1 Tax=Thioalkalivibrio sulfidiphilus (strain HL-EbGR7) TaxID=396588 RepID=B8GU64_THISH|nr:CBS domain-containing protein [Thioalkalivibrio sulfidiphilus]ACL71347.1 putative signal transduction protein with CBS domains [Thioalkalivibrio sulfidiphilus HL-EbGr7]
MKVGEFCNRDVVVMGGEESAQAAAALMRAHHVGDVVLVEDRGGVTTPLGIVTDRDLVLEVMVPGVDAASLAARDLVTAPLVTVREDQGLFDALELMRARGVRRLPVVNGKGALLGILAVDDLVGLMGEMLSRLSSVVARQVVREEKQRP